MRPHSSMDLIFYLRDFTPDLASRIHMIGSQQFLEIYKSTLQVEFALILVGKLPPRVFMPMAYATSSSMQHPMYNYLPHL